MMASVTYGDPWDASNLQGPLINARQRDRVLGYIESGRSEGARLVRGGGRPAHLPKGYFVEPTLFADVDPASTIAQEEIFGPVLCVIPYDGDDEAVRIANGTMYGLSAVVTGGTLDHARAVAASPACRNRDGERRILELSRRPVRRLQAERGRPRERAPGIRGVPRDEGPRLSGQRCRLSDFPAGDVYAGVP